jgi:hypothetical protein
MADLEPCQRSLKVGGRLAERDRLAAIDKLCWQRAGMSPRGRAKLARYGRRMEHYRVYLRAELGKLQNVDDSQEFLSTVGCGFELFDLPRDVDVLSERFATQELAEAFVDGLNDQALIDLTSCCGLWRKNGIAENLTRWQSPHLIEVPIEKVLLKRAEKDLWAVFDRLEALTAIGVDDAVLAHPVYAAHSDNERIAYRWCLANPEPGRHGIYRVFDGMHRAIQMLRNRETLIPLCVVEAPWGS